MDFRIKYSFIWLLAVQLLVACDNADIESEDQESSTTFELSSETSNQIFSITLATENKSPAPIGKYHNWTVSIVDQQSNPVYPAIISVSGGMPDHGHGLPTQPRVTEHLGNGKYKLEGMKFNMDGSWKIRIHVATEQHRDIAEFSFDVTY